MTLLWFWIVMKGSAVTRDMGCCSTVNPILAAGYGIRIVDCGLPQLSMHRSFNLFKHSIPTPLNA